MLGKLKEVVSLSDEIRDLKVSLSSMDTELRLLKDTISKKIDSDSEERTKIFKELHEAVLDISKIKSLMRETSEEYLSELNAFRITKKNIQERLTTEFQEESKRVSKEMSTYLSSYKKLESEMNVVSAKVSEFGGIINTLKSLSQEISKKDFDLKNYAKVLDQNDREKVELLKRIDSLEKLLSAMKRSKAPRRM